MTHYTLHVQVRGGLYSGGKLIKGASALCLL